MCSRVVYRACVVAIECVLVVLVVRRWCRLEDCGGRRGGARQPRSTGEGLVRAAVGGVDDAHVGRGRTARRGRGGSAASERSTGEGLVRSSGLSAALL